MPDPIVERLARNALESMPVVTIWDRTQYGKETVSLDRPALAQQEHVLRDLIRAAFLEAAKAAREHDAGGEGTTMCACAELVAARLEEIARG